MDYTNLANRPTFKRSYNTMAQASAPPQFLDFAGASRAPQDEHYQNHEHRPQRRRLEDPWRQGIGRHHYPGDGFDFRRPIMSGAADTIDLTEDRNERGITRHRLALPGTRDAAVGTGSATSSRAQRMPRFPRDIIDLADSDEEEGQEQQHQLVQRPTQRQRAVENLQMPVGDDLFMPQMEEEDGDSLFIPLAPTRPMTAGQRRPGYPQRLTPAMNFDDVEIVSSRPISRNTSRRGTPAVFMPGQPAARDTPPNADATIDLTADDDDDDEVILTDARPRHGINGELPAVAGSAVRNRERHHAGGDFGIARLYQRIRGQNVAAFGFLGGYMRQPYPGDDDDDAAHIRAAQAMARGRADHARGYRVVVEGDVAAARAERRRPIVTPIPNIMMNYGEVGFDMGLQMGVAEPAAPKYEPPPPAAEGFTRSPTEDEEVVCPNCGDELAVGKDEIKQQVWVVKSCGHAYCGECATRTRTTTTSKKGKGKASDPSVPPPLKKCVVVGCEKSANKKDLIHVYMSS